MRPASRRPGRTSSRRYSEAGAGELKRDGRQPLIPHTLRRFIWRSSGRHQVWLVLLSAITFPLGLAPIELQRRIIDDAIKPGDLELLLIFCGAYALVVALHGALKFLMNVYRGWVSESVVRLLRRRIHDWAQHSPGQQGENGDHGTTVAMMAAEVEPLGGFVGESVSVPVVETGALLSIFVYMIVVEPLLALAAIGLFIPQMVVVPWVQAAINRRSMRRIKLVREIGDTIVGHAASEVDESLVERDISRIFDERIVIYRLKYGLKFLINFLNRSAEIGVLLVGGWLVIDGASEVGTVVAFLTGLGRIRDPWRELVAFFRSASDARVKYGLVRSQLAD